MRITVFGAGSLGCAIGGLLSRNHEVTLVGRKENMDAIRRDGLRVSGGVEMNAKVQTCESVEGLAQPDLLILATKAYHTRSVVDALKPLTWNATRVLTLQNGIGNLEIIREWKGPKAFGGTTTMGAVLVSPGDVRVSGLGQTVIGSDADAAWASRISEAFSSCGIPAEVSGAVEAHIWSKAIVNSCINPLTAILRVQNGRLLESDAISRLMAEVCRECVSVAEAAGVVLPKGDRVEHVRAVARDTAANRSSMLRDLERQRRTEIAYMNGMIVSLGARFGIPTPLNRALTAIVQALEPAVPEKG